MILLVKREYTVGGKGLTGPICQFLFFKPFPKAEREGVCDVCEECDGVMK